MKTIIYVLIGLQVVFLIAGIYIIMIGYIVEGSICAIINFAGIAVSLDSLEKVTSKPVKK